MIKAFAGDRKSGFLIQTRNGNPLGASFVNKKLHRALEAIGFVNELSGTHFAREHAFRRSRNTDLRDETSCPDSIIKIWLGQELGEGMSEVHDRVKHSVRLLRSLAESCGYEFDLPPNVPTVPEIGAKKETA